MSPDEYLTQICEPCIIDFVDNPTSLRRAWVATIALLHFEDYLAHHRHADVTHADVLNVRAELIRGFPPYDAIQDIGNANKHFVRRHASSRKGLSVQNYRTGPAAAFDDGTYFDDGTSFSDSPDVVRIEFKGEIIDALELCQSCLKYLKTKV